MYLSTPKEYLTKWKIYKLIPLKLHIPTYVLRNLHIPWVEILHCEDTTLDYFLTISRRFKMKLSIYILIEF